MTGPRAVSLILPLAVLAGPAGAQARAPRAIVPPSADTAWLELQNVPPQDTSRKFLFSAMRLASVAIHLPSVAPAPESDTAELRYRLWRRQVFLRQRQLESGPRPNRASPRLSDSLVYFEVREIDCRTPRLRRLRWSLRSSSGALSGSDQPSDSGWKLLTPDSPEEREWGTTCRAIAASPPSPPAGAPGSAGAAPARGAARRGTPRE